MNESPGRSAKSLSGKAATMSGRTDSVADAQSHSLFIYIMKSELRLSISSVLCMSGAILISLSSASRGRNRNKLREIGKHSPSTNGGQKQRASPH